MSDEQEDQYQEDFEKDEFSEEVKPPFYDFLNYLMSVSNSLFWNKFDSKSSYPFSENIIMVGNPFQPKMIWKDKYFVENKLNIAYDNHIKTHSAHIARQPYYYKGMFDIMN